MRPRTIQADDDGITIIDNGPGIPAETVIEPADLGALDRGAAAGPGGVRALEGEQVLGEAPFEGDKGFGEAGMGADNTSEPMNGHT